MKQTRTTLKELTAAYRAVLRHGILCNAIALGLIAATPAMAETVATVNNVEYETLKDAVTGNATSGSTINLLTSIDQGTGISMPTNSDLVLDLGGNTYTGYTDPAGSTGTKRQVFQAQGGDITIKNGTIDIADTPDGEFRMVIQNYSNLTLDNVVLDGSNANSAATPYALSNNNGTIHIKDSEIIGKEGGYAFDVYSWKQLGTSAANTYGDVSVTVDNSRIVGKIEVDTDGSLIGDTKHELTINGGELVAVTGGSKITTNGTTTLNGVTMSGNSAANGAAVHNTQKAATKGGEGISGRGILNITDSTFSDNTASDLGGAIYNEGTLTLTSATFTNNTAVGTYAPNDGGTAAVYSDGAGGAIRNTGTLTVGGTFTGNSAFSGGAISNTGTLTITDDSLFDSNNVNIAGGAISNTGTLTIGDNVTFNNNTSFLAEGKLDTATGGSEMGGAIYSEGTASSTKTITIGDGVKFTNNSSANGNLYLFGAHNVTIGDNVEFSGNTSDVAGAIRTSNLSGNGVTTMTIGDNAKFTGNTATNGIGGAAIMLAVGGDSVTIGDNAIVSNNTGTAIYNSASDLEFGSNVTISGNTANAVNGDGWSGVGAAVKNMGEATLTFDGGSFTNNTAAKVGGAIYNYGNESADMYATINLNADSGDLIFSDNTANGVANDIYNSGILNLSAAAGNKISLTGGIAGNGIGEVYIKSGLVEIASMTDQGWVEVEDGGELHLINGAADASNLDYSWVEVDDGGKINTIDGVINDYETNYNVFLNDGALVAGDIDYVNGLADTYSADNGATITYTLANALNLTGIQYGGETKEIRVTNEGATINKDAEFGWFDSDHGLTLESGGAGTGTILVSGTSGGINAAVDATDETAQEFTYTASAASETFDGADNVIQNANMTVTGNGNETTSNTIVFANDMIVDGQSTLSMQDINLENTDEEAITVQQGGTMYLTDARVGVDLNILGTLVSDPTYYDARVVNSGTSTFTGDVFENGSSLTNSAIVNLNNVEFVSGSTLTGLAGNVLNVAGTGNIFNGTSTGNNVVLASGADYTGTLSNGSVDARNGGIDTFSGAVSGGDLYVDADLNAATNKIDSFTGATGATIKGIKLANSGYGTGNKVTLTLDGATFDDNVDIDGFRYYTQVINNGSSLVFRDKLLNESGMYTNLGSWTGGHYIAANVDLDHEATDGVYLTVGDALTELDKQLYAVSTVGTIAASNDKFVTGGAVYTALLDKQDNLTAGSGINISGTTISASGLTTSNLAANAGIVKTQLAEAVQTSLDKADNALQATALNNTALTGNTTAENLAVSGTMTVDGKAVLTAADVADDYAGTTLADARTYVGTNSDKLATIGTTAALVEDLFDAKQAWTDSTLGITSADENAVNNAYAGTNYLTEATSLTGADIELDSKIKENADAIALLNGDEDETGSVKNIAKGYADTALADAQAYTDALANGAVASNTSAINTLNGAENETGSVKNIAKGYADTALANAKTYTDGAIETALEQVTAGVTAAYDHAHEWAEGLLGVDVDANVNTQLQTALSDLASADNTTNSIESTTIAGALHELDTDVAAVDERLTAAEGTLESHDDALTTLNGDENTAGSVAKTVKDNAENATYTNSGGSSSLANASTVGGALNLLGSATDDNISAIELLNGDESTEGSVAYAAANAVATANAYTDSKLAETRDSAIAASNAYTDRRIEDLDKNLSAGVAGAVALSSVAVSGVERGEVSVGAGYGYFNGQSAAAFGATMGLSNRWSINAGAGISNADVSFRAGTNYKFKLF